MRGARAPRLVLTAGIWLWLAGIVLFPATLFPLGGYICHQRPERSFVVHGQQMPVCARCTGLYAGAALGAPVALLAAAALTSRRARSVLAIAALPTLITWTLEFGGGVSFSNVARFVAALPLGSTAAWLVLAVLADTRAASG